MKRTFIYQDEKSQKFWSIETQGTNFTVNFGKLGTSGQTSEKSFTAKDECQKATDKLIAEKVKKGYKETADNTDVANSSAKLKFKSFNFKLIIINELMYKQEWLKPKFDVWKFAEKEGIDIEEKGYDPIPKVVKYFKNLEIDEKFANEVKEVELWGGNDIYHQIWPFWDGECDYFDVTKLTAEEVKQFPNLKITVAEAALTPESIKVLESCGAFAKKTKDIKKDVQEQIRIANLFGYIYENGFVINKDGVLISYDGDEKDLTIPPVIGGIKVLKIGNKQAVVRKGLTRLVIPEGVTDIDYEAFRFSYPAYKTEEITEVVLPVSIENIDDDAFFKCGIKKITPFENLVNLKSIGQNAFCENYITRLTIPALVKETEQDSFSSCCLTHLTICEGVTKIGGGSFRSNKLVEVVLPKSLEIICWCAFESNNLTEIVIPENVEKIETCAFQGNNLTEIVIPENIEKIEAGSFSYNPLKVITICRGGMDFKINDDFDKCYDENGRKAGTYILDGKKWKLKE